MQLMDVLWDMVSDSVMLVSADARLLRINQVCAQILGYRPEEIADKPLTQIKSVHHAKDFWENLCACLDNTGEWHGQLCLRKKNGEPYSGWGWARRVEDGAWLLLISDVPQHEKMPDEARFHASQYDFLTGLPNRLALMQRLETTLALAKRHVTRFAVLYLNLDGLNSINTLLGYDVGDALLQQVAKRLENRMREIDIVARVQGDEFVVVITEGRRMEEIIRIARTVHKWLQTPFSIRDNTVTVSASTGIAVYPDDSQDLTDLVKYAHSAMLQGKNAGSGHFCFYSQNHNNTI
jgi:diguanylate cyclase (GGDEF)-like protein